MRRTQISLLILSVIALFTTGCTSTRQTVIYPRANMEIEVHLLKVPASRYEYWQTVSMNDYWQSNNSSVKNNYVSQALDEGAAILYFNFDNKLYQLETKNFNSTNPKDQETNPILSQWFINYNLNYNAQTNPEVIFSKKDLTSFFGQWKESDHLMIFSNVTNKEFRKKSLPSLKSKCWDKKEKVIKLSIESERVSCKTIYNCNS